MLTFHCTVYIMVGMMTHSDYLLGKKYRLLYNLYHEIYCLLCLLPAQVRSVDANGTYTWSLYRDREGVLAELTSSKDKSLAERLSLHKEAYRNLKRLLGTSSLKFNKDGLVRLF